MGCCFSRFAPSPDRVEDMVYGIVDRNYENYLNKYKLGMRENDPEPYVCEEVLDKTSKSGKKTLTFGKSTDEEVERAAKDAALGEAARSDVQDAVWEQLEPEVTDAVGKAGLRWQLRYQAIRFARKQSDFAVEKSWERVRDKMADKRKGKGEEQPVEEPSETHATDADNA